MTKLTWGAFGERYFETGIDRGVLYLQGRDGVAWSGLTSVQESPVGGKPTPYYIDGHKYANVATAEEYAATIEAFSAPLEFGVCDGTAEISPGLFLSEQPRKSFSFSYRTLVGNDLEGVDHGYKIHLVYNALAEPTSRAYATLDDSAEANSLSWNISTLPPRFPGRKPTAHLVIDSRRMSPVAMTILEGYLYGADGIAPRLPSPARIFSWLQEIEPPGQTVPWQDVRRPVDFKGSMSSEITELRNLVTNPRGRNTSGTVTIRENLFPNPSFENGLTSLLSSISATLIQTSLSAAVAAGGYALSVSTSEAGSSGGWVRQHVSVSSNDWEKWLGFSLVVRRSSGWIEAARLFYECRDSEGAIASGYLNGRILDSTPNEEQERLKSALFIEPNTVEVALWLRPSGSPDSAVAPSDGTMHTDAWMACVAPTQESAVEAVSEYFDGDTWAGDPDLTPEWTGTPGESTSRLVAPRPAYWVSNNSARLYYSERVDALAMRATDMFNYSYVSASVGSYGRATSVLEILEPNKIVSARARWDYSQTGWTEIEAPGTIYATENDISGSLLVQQNGTVDGDILYFRIGVYEDDYSGPYFDGHTPTFLYQNQEPHTEWEGEPDNSVSIARLLTTIPPNSHHGDIELINGDLYINQDGTFRNYGPIPEPPL